MMRSPIPDSRFLVFPSSRSARGSRQWAVGSRQSAIKNQKPKIKNQKSLLLLLLLAAALPHFASADSITVIQDNAPVMSGRTTLTRLPRGTKLPVKRTQGSWYGVNVQVGGKSVFGWVHRKYVVTTRQAVTLETRAQKAFEELKAKTDKLAAQGKYQEAIDLVDSFPERYWHTAAQNKVRELGLKLEQRATGDTTYVEAEAEAEFRTRKSQADKLLKEGKLAEALDTLKGFPGKYSNTKWAEEVGRYVLELEARARAPLADIEKKILELVRDGHFDTALEQVQALTDKGIDPGAPHIKATETYIQLHKRAAARPDDIYTPLRTLPGHFAGAYHFRTDPYLGDEDYHRHLGQFRRIIAPPSARVLKLVFNQKPFVINIPTASQLVALGNALVGKYPWSANLRLALARACARAKRPDDALTHFGRAVELDHNHSVVSLDAAIEKARVLTAVKRPGIAIALLEGLLRRHPTDFIALSALGDACLAAGDNDKAVAAWTKSLDANPHQLAIGPKLAAAKGQTISAERPKELTRTEIYRQVEESCVLIRTDCGSGSGYAVRADGLIATNYHVIAGGKAIFVICKRAGKKVMIPFAHVVLIAPLQDIALLKVEARRHPFRPLRLGRASDVLPGEDVIVIGNPGMGGAILDFTITRGIVSNRDRTFGKGNHYIQTDAAVNPGTSGGPLLNMRAEVVGMVTRKAAQEGTGFALHIDQVRRVLPACFPQAR